MDRRAGMYRAVRNAVRLLAGAGLIGAAVSLSTPLTLGVVDSAGVRIGCGSGLHAEAAAAQRTDAFNHHLRGVSAAFIDTDYTEQCAAMVSDRRWLTTMVIIASVGLLLATLRPVRARGGRTVRAPGQPAWVGSHENPVSTVPSSIPESLTVSGGARR